MFDLSKIEKKRKELEMVFKEKGGDHLDVPSGGVYACSCSGGCDGSCEQSCQGRCSGCGKS